MNNYKGLINLSLFSRCVVNMDCFRFLTLSQTNLFNSINFVCRKVSDTDLLAPVVKVEVATKPCRYTLLSQISFKITSIILLQLLMDQCVSMHFVVSATVEDIMSTK